MDKSKKEIDSLVKQIKKRRLKERNEYGVEKFIHEVVQKTHDKKIDANIARIEDRRRMIIAPMDAVVTSMFDICRDEYLALSDIVDDDRGAQQLDAYKEALTIEGRRLVESKKWIFIFDESEDYPRFLYWYHPLNCLWYHDLYQRIADLRGIVEPTSRGFLTLGELWEQT